MRLLSRLFALAVLATVAVIPATAIAQQDSPGQAIAVQYSVPFGAVSGQLMLLGNYLVFYDAAQPGSSFVILRTQIAGLAIDGAVVNLDTTGPIRDREGARTQFSFRLDDAADGGAIVTWRSRGSHLAVEALGGEPSDAEMVYTAKHDHTIGSCRGQLIIRRDFIAYDSLNDIGHSRRWELLDVRELRQPNPYQLSIEGFRGGTYNLELQGQGMDPADFRTLSERIASARTSR